MACGCNEDDCGCHQWQEDLDGEVRCAGCQAKSWHSDAMLPCGSGTRYDNSDYLRYMGEEPPEK